MAKKKISRVKTGRGKVGTKVILGVVAVLVALPLAIGAGMNQTNVRNFASEGQQALPAIDLNSAGDITTTANPDGTMGPATAQANLAATLPEEKKGELVFKLASIDSPDPTVAYAAPTVAYTAPTQSYVAPTQVYTAPTQAYTPPVYVPPVYPTPKVECPYQTPGQVYGAKTQGNGDGKGNGNGQGNGKGNGNAYGNDNSNPGYGGGNPGNGNGKKGMHGPQDITALCLTITKVEVHIAYLGTPGSNTNPVDHWETLNTVTPTTIDLFNLNAPALLGLTKLGAGRYTQVRLYISKAKAKLASGQVVDVTLAGHNNIVKIVKSFEIVTGQTTHLTLSFDPSHSVIRTGNSYMLKPVVAKMEETH